ncbi:MAG: type II toxin-antitoxin system ParD family antitoxin [Rhodospirillaceae bacterium]|nr:type II toxin-antitoxin system ParD family antitoxin [Rhodospirillaceae bacterium]
MNIHLTGKLEKFVRAKVESGDYNNASEVMRDAVRLLMNADEERAAKLKRLRKGIAEGRKAIAEGRVTTFRTPAEIDDFFRTL